MDHRQSEVVAVTILEFILIALLSTVLFIALVKDIKLRRWIRKMNEGR